MAVRPKTAAVSGPDPAPSESTIVNRIRDRITSGQLPLGARIVDRDLAEELDVSRTPVREALLLLRGEGLVDMKPQSGTFVFDPGADDIRQICATRAIIETGAIRLLLDEGSGDTLAGLHLLVGQAALALDDGDLQRCDTLDWMFHESVIAATGNSYLIRAYQGISSLLRALRQRMPQEHSRIARAIAQHRRIIDLCAANRIDEVESQIASHVSNVERLLTLVDPKG